MVREQPRGDEPSPYKVGVVDTGYEGEYDPGMSCFKPVLVLLTLSCLLGALGAQDTRATIGGRVMDPQGALVPNASVEVVDADTNVKQHVKTNDKGVWAVNFCCPATTSSPFPRLALRPKPAKASRCRRRTTSNSIRNCRWAPRTR